MSLVYSGCPWMPRMWSPYRNISTPVFSELAITSACGGTSHTCTLCAKLVLFCQRLSHAYSFRDSYFCSYLSQLRWVYSKFSRLLVENSVCASRLREVTSVVEPQKSKYRKAVLMYLVAVALNDRKMRGDVEHGEPLDRRMRGVDAGHSQVPSIRGPASLPT